MEENKVTGTRVFGQSDDNVYLEGEYEGQYSSYKTASTKKGILLIFSDGSILQIRYGKAELAIWGINLVRKGSLFDRIDYCNDDDADIYSDIAYFKEGISFVYGCSEWEKIN